MLHDFQAQHNQPQTTRDIVQRRDQLLAAQDFWQNQLVASRNDLEKFIADEFSRREAASKVFVEEFERNRLSQDAASEAATELTLESEPHRPTESSLALAPPIEPMVSPAMPKVSPAMPVGAPALPMVEVLNPEWNARAIQLQAATVRREELLRQVTEEHPSAVEATMAVQHLKADLASTPRTIPVTQPIDLAQTNTSTRAVLVDAPAPALKANQTPPASSSEENTIEQTAAPTSPAPPAPFDAERVRNEIEALATVKDLRNAIANAEERLAKQKLDLEALPPIEQSAVESVEIVSPAKVVEHVARMPSRARLSIVLAIACGIGAFAMHCCPKPGTLETFQRVEEVIESARLPLRGPLPTTDGPAIPQDLAIRWPKLAGTFVNVSEWTILATVALLLVSISIDSSQSRTLASDPLRAILTAVHRFSSNP